MSDTLDELNAAVAEAMGYTDVRRDDWEDVDIEARVIYPLSAIRGTIKGKRKRVPDYARDLNEAVKLLEGEDWLMSKLYDGGVGVELNYPETGPVYGFAPTIPEAICRAWLMAHGKDV